MNLQMISRLRAKTDKLIDYPEIDFWEYFDLTADPDELHNAYQDAAVQPRVAELKQQLLQRAVSLDRSTNSTDRA